MYENILRNILHFHMFQSFSITQYYQRAIHEPYTVTIKQSVFTCVHNVLYVAIKYRVELEKQIVYV